MKHTMRTRATLGAVVLALGLAPACSKDDGASVRSIDSGSGSGSGSATGASGVAEAPKCVPVGDAASAATKVEVNLTEWKMTPAPAQAPAGKTSFHITNAGKEAHEMLVVRAADPAALPTKADGSIDESKLDQTAFVGEVEPFPAASSCDGTFELTAGSYSLICNIVETEPNGELESHYQEGMRTAFTVT
jgi:uncharacterized cupredoxin-like copper-binding protein